LDRFGARRWTRLVMPRDFTGIISLSKRLVRLEVRRRRWLLPPFVRTSFPDPVTRKRFEVALWVFSLYFPVVCLRGTFLLLSLFGQPYTGRQNCRPVGYAIVTFFLEKAYSASLYFFFAALPGASTISMVRPSRAGDCSTSATSESSSAISFRSFSAISG